MNSTTRNQDLVRSTAKVILFLAGMLFFLCLQFRAQLQNGFTMLYGDSYDAAIVVAILEHWLSVWHGSSQWSELYYFFPYKNTLAQTDGYFIIGIIYSIIRSMGLDPFISSELSNAVAKCIGFAGFYWMIRRVFRVNFYWSVRAAGLFMIANNLTAHGSRVQLATLAFAPILTTLLWTAHNNLIAGQRRKLMLNGGTAGIALGAWALTCFYITWFYIFFTVFFSLMLWIVSPREARTRCWQALQSHWAPLLIVFAITCLSFVPLLSVYLPKAAESGLRSYESALHYTVPPAGILQVGKTNVLFGGLYNKALAVMEPDYSAEGEYYNTGIAPILFVIFICASLSLLIGKTHFTHKVPLRAAALATLLTWIFVIQIHGMSLWYLIFNFFPGAQALNVVAAYQIFLTFPIVALSVVYLSRISPRLPASALLVLVGLLISEELNSAYVNLDRQAELQKIADVPPPPAECAVFYVSGWPSQTSAIDKIYAHNVSAMLIAELIKTPTINGFASFNPPGWNLADPNAPDYDARVATYIESHKIVDVCKLDLASKSWSRPPLVP